MKKNEQEPFKFRGTRFFIVILFSYLLLFLTNRDAALLSMSNAATILIRVFPILLGVILFSGLFNYFLKPKQITRHLGGESSKKGWFWSIIAGVVSHGPMYAWYPFLEDLRKQGTRDGLIAAFFYARAIKVPLLPLMIDYFGVIFTAVLCGYILMGAFIQGWLLQRLQDYAARSSGVRIQK